MKQIETIQEFYSSLPKDRRLLAAAENNGVGHFNIFPRWRCSGIYQRRDFYKIVLVVGTGILYYADKKFTIDRPALFFTNPAVPYSWQPISEKQEGWLCLFTEEFIQSANRSAIEQDYPILHLNENPVTFLDETLFKEISSLFEKMAEEMSSGYLYKYSVLSNYLQLLIHQVQKLNPRRELNNQYPSAAHRTTFQFLELLEQQFPVNSPDTPLAMRTPQDYAQRLAVHVNHLNHSVKEATTRTSTEIITDRIVREAKALLKNTDWNISEIAYALGFEYPSHFTNFFHKNSGLSPREQRNHNL
ncbi:AraC family transcriptional regulator [Dysgonomonas sp. ZJ709]|uniref:AraC family transcriptional regulator n=1 Tax=Dysgonomonas sp. ZJ709 TaxID=2709797 RepID=UPI0013EA2C2D|nr:helix-turn-helix domain-containing protein [Dysgonomonas sp. ZJ709]